MNLKNIFKEIGAEAVLIFDKSLPGGWEEVTEALINGLNKAQTVTNNPFLVTAAALFPDGLGSIVLKDVQLVIADALPVIEIAQGAEQAIAGITDPVAKADAVIAYVVANINKLPQAWQGKHWLDVAVAILTKLLGVSTTVANAIVNLKLGQMKAASV